MTPKRLPGAAVGIVTRLDDPEQQGRVMVEIPWLGDGIQSNWCRMRVAQGGYSRGNFIRPEVGDEVLVMFEQGEINQPWIVGVLWNGKDGIPGPGNPDGKNDDKFFQSRSAHQMIFNDGDDGGYIEFHDSKAKLHTKIDVPGQHIHSLADTGEISINAPNGKVRIECKDLNVHSTETTTVNVKNSHDISVTGTRNLAVQQQNLQQLASSSLKVTTPSLSLSASSAAEFGTGNTTLSVGQVTAKVEPTFNIEHSGAVTRTHGTATYRIDDFCTEVAGVGRSGAMTLNATSLGMNLDEAFIARIGGPVNLQSGLMTLKGATVALGKDGGDGKNMGKAGLINIMGGLVNLNPQMFTGPATKMLDVMMGFDAHYSNPGIPPVAIAPFPFMPHGFVLPIILDCKTSVLVNNMPMAGSGSTAFGLHMPPFLPLPWTPMPIPVRQLLASAALALFVPMVMSAGMMVISMAQAAFAGGNPMGVLTGMSAQQWRARFLPCTMSPGAFLAFLAGLAPHPMASGSITIGSPNVLGEDMPFGMMLPFPFSNSCSDIPVVPNATVMAMSNVMVGVSLKQVLAQLAMALVGYGITKRLSRSKIFKKIADPVDPVSGARVDEDIDLESPGPLPFVITRQHLSVAEEGGVLGRRNRLCFEQRLESPPLDEREDRVWVWHTGDLRAIELPFTEAHGEWHFDYPEKVEICRADDETWDIADADGITHRFERWSTRRARLAARMDRHGNTITYHYEDERRPLRVTRITDSAGRRYRLTYTRGPDGDRLSTITGEGHPANPDSRVLRTYRYDDKGRLLATAGPDGVETRYAYDDAGRVAQRIEPGGYIWHWHYDGADRVTTTYGDDLRYYYTFDYQPGAEMTVTRDHGGHRTLWHYDENRVIDRVIDPEGGIQEEKWVENDLVSSSTAEDLVVERTYDERGRLSQETLVGGGRRSTTYDARGFVVAETSPTGAVTAYVRDGRGNAIKTRHPDGSQTLRRYDAQGRVIAEETPDAIEHAYVYDGAGDLVEETHDGSTIRHRYDAFGHRVATTNPAGQTTRFTVDLAGRRTRAEHPDGTVEQWRYDGAGHCVEQQTRNGGTWRYDYDGAGRKLRTHTPEGRVLESTYGLNDRYAGHRTDSGRGFTYAYDRCDRLVEHTTDDGVTDRYTYDSAGRLIRRDYGDGSHVEWTPAPHGEPAAARTADGIEQLFTHDPSERIVEAIEHPPGTPPRQDAERPAPDEIRVAFHRRKDGVVLAEHGPHAAVHYGYAPGTRLTRYRVDATEIRIARDRKGRPTAIDGPDGQWRIEHGPDGETWTGPDGTVHRVGGGGWSVRDAAGQPVAGYAARVDDLGDCIGETLRRAADARLRGYEHQFSYDRDRRLADAVDADGNRRLPGAEYGPANRLVRDAYGPVTYDRRGQITRRADAHGTHRYRWDDLGRLIEAETPDGTFYTYRYDAFARLIERVRDPIVGPITRWRFIWAGDVLAGEDRPDGSAVRYLRLAARDWTPWAAWHTAPDGTTALHRLHADVRGAVVAATHGSTLSWWGEYDAYGALVAHAGDFDQRLRLQGMWSDPDTGLCFNRFRWYAPAWGRYLSPDPLGVEGNRNLYAYTDGDPIHFADPLGLGHESTEAGTTRRDNDSGDTDASPPPRQQNTEPGDGAPPRTDTDGDAGTTTPRTDGDTDTAPPRTDGDDGTTTPRTDGDDGTAPPRTDGDDGTTTPRTDEGDSPHSWPDRTSKAQEQCKIACEAADVAFTKNSEKNGGSPVVAVYTHGDGPTSVGLSGKPGTKATKRQAKLLQKQLDKMSTDPDSPAHGMKFKVHDEPISFPGYARGGDDAPLPGNCAEPKAANGAHGADGFDVRWRGDRDFWDSTMSQKHGYTGPNADADQGYPQMNPCATCSHNESGINSGGTQ